MRALPYLVLAVSLAACGTPAPEGPGPGDPIPFGGGTIKIPAGDGWKIVDRNPESVVFERTISADGHRLTAIAALFPFEFDDLEECRDSLHRETYVASPTHRNPRGNVGLVSSASPPYVQVRYSAEEADGPNPDAQWRAIQSEFRWFLRPGDNRGVMLSFGENRPRDTAPAEYQGQAMVFFASYRPAPARQQ